MMISRKKSYKIKEYFRKTFMNKLCATILLGGGWLTGVYSKDFTGFVFLACIAIPLFFTKEKWIN